MKLLFQKSKVYKEHITYVAKLDNRNVYMTLEKDIIVGRGSMFTPPNHIVVYIHTSSNVKDKHLCCKCKELYPKFQYAKHAKERH